MSVTVSSDTNGLPAVLAAKIESARRLIPTLSQRGLAALEREVFDFAVSQTPGLRHRDFLAKYFGAKHQHAEIRSILFNAGKAAEPLWERVNSGEMSLHTAIRLFREAKAKVKAGGVEIDLDVAISTHLREYDSQPATRTPAGHYVRKKLISSLPDLDKVRSKPNGKKRREPVDPEKTKRFWAQLREDIAAYIGPKLSGVDPIVGERLYKDFERDLKVLLDEFGHKIYRVTSSERQHADQGKEVGRKQIVDACRVLNMEAPKPGAPVNLTLANKQKKRMAALYHPDKVGGSEATRPQYEAVIEAYIVVEQYAEQHGETK